jgi:hypothetical protein
MNSVRMLRDMAKCTYLMYEEQMGPTIHFYCGEF